MAQEQSSQQIFLSYSREDVAFARELREWLLEQGHQPWMDLFDIPAGVRWPDEIDRALNGADVVVGIMTEASLASDNVKNEWDWSIANGRRLVLILAAPCRVPFHYVSRNYIDFTTDQASGYDLLGQQLASPDREGTVDTSNAGRAPVQIVAREREQAVLQERLDDAIGGGGNLVLVSGEAGIGKTTLVDDLLRRARERGARILSGGCYDLTTTPPYGLWQELLAASEAGPDAGQHLDQAQDVGGLQAGDSPQRFFEGVLRFLHDTASRQPLVVVLEDLHWSDRDSLDLLRFVARRISGAPVLLVVTYRDDELTRRDPLYRLLPALVRESRAERLRLGRLSDAALHQLVQSRYDLSDDDAGRLADYLDRAAEGNPLFVHELLRTLQERGIIAVADGAARLGALDEVPVPELVQQLIDLRVDELDTEIQEQLEIASVLGQTVRVDLWGRVAGVGSRDLLDAMEQGAAAGVLTVSEDGASIRFTHALLREALYERIFPPRRREWHRAAGEAQAADPGANPSAVADHFRRCDDPRTAEWLVEAGDYAMRSGANATALEHYEAAVSRLEAAETSPEALGWLYFRLVSCRFSADPSSARSYLAQARQRPADSDNRALDLGLDWIESPLNLRFGGGGLTGVEEHARRWLRLTSSEKDLLGRNLEAVGTSPRAVIHSSIALLIHAGNYPVAQDLIGSLPAGQPDDPRSRWSRFVLNEVYALMEAALGRPESAMALYRDLQALTDRASKFETARAIGAPLIFVTLIYYPDDLALREREAARWNEAFMDAARLGEAEPEPFPLRLSRLFWIEGRWDELTQIDYADVTSIPRWQAGWVYGNIARFRGRSAEAWGIVGTLLPAGPESERETIYFDSLVPLQELAANLAMDAGDLDLAREWIEANQRWLDETGRVQGRAENHLLWARFFGLTGDSNSSRAHAGQALKHASDPRQPLALLAALRLSGHLDVAEGREDRARDHLRASLEIADACRAPFERALTLLEMARLHRAAGDAGRVQALLAEVRQICEPLGAQPALDRVAEFEAGLEASRG